MELPEVSEAELEEASFSISGPTECLDEIYRRIVELVRDLSRDVKTVVITSHLGEFEESTTESSSSARGTAFPLCASSPFAIWGYSVKERGL